MVTLAVQRLVVLTVGVLVLAGEGGVLAGPATFVLCGRKLSNVMSKVCYIYNSPSWGYPAVVEQPTTVARRKRQISDECCARGCTWEQLKEYCSVSAPEPDILKGLHMISDRSAETEKEPPRVISAPAAAAVLERRESKGVKRWEPLREMSVRNVIRAAPVVGTVSPLLTWGRTINTDMPPVPVGRNQYAYVTV